MTGHAWRSATAMSALDLVKALDGRWHGAYGTARCPSHRDRNPSLSVRDGTDGAVVFHCFAGCDWRDVKDALRARGILPERGHGRAAPRRRRRPPDSAKPRPVDVDQQQRMEFACEKWCEAVPITDTPADVYLRARSLEPGPDGWPPT